jgi:hypothetical protein
MWYRDASVDRRCSINMHKLTLYDHERKRPQRVPIVVGGRRGCGFIVEKDTFERDRHDLELEGEG